MYTERQNGKRLGFIEPIKCQEISYSLFELRLIKKNEYKRTFTKITLKSVLFVWPHTNLVENFQRPRFNTIQVRNTGITQLELKSNKKCHQKQRTQQ
jgi:hypothetical protein